MWAGSAARATHVGGRRTRRRPTASARVPARSCTGHRSVVGDVVAARHAGLDCGDERSRRVLVPDQRLVRAGGPDEAADPPPREPKHLAGRRGVRAVEGGHAQHHTTASVGCEPLHLAFGVHRRDENVGRGDRVAERETPVAAVRVQGGEAGIDQRRHLRCQRGVDEVAVTVGTNPVVLPPGRSPRGATEGGGGQVQDGVSAAQRRGQERRVEQRAEHGLRPRCSRRASHVFLSQVFFIVVHRPLVLQFVVIDRLTRLDCIC